MRVIRLSRLRYTIRENLEWDLPLGWEVRVAEDGVIAVYDPYGEFFATVQPEDRVAVERTIARIGAEWSEHNLRRREMEKKRS